MIILTIAQFREKLPIILGAGIPTIVIAPPGAGKTYNAGEIARICGPTVMVNGGSEVDWKMLFPYRMPNGRLMLGTAMAAAGWDLDAEGNPFHRNVQAGALVVDEVNRVPAEQKSQFQLLGSDRAVEIPGATPPRRVVLNITCVATANPFGLGVEEMSNAELDRYDAFICLQPTPDEVAQIVSKTMPAADPQRVLELFERGRTAPTVVPAAAAIIYACVQALAKRLDDSKFHRPEGIRLTNAIGAMLSLGIFSPAMVFRSAVERCFPLGRRGAERFRAEFDGVVQDVAGTFASKLGALGGAYKQQPVVQRAAPTGSTAGSLQSKVISVESFSELKAELESSADATVVVRAVALPRRAMELLPQITQAFGAGLAMEVMHKCKSASCGRGGVSITFNSNLGPARSPGGCDAISFTAVDREKVLRFCSLVEPRS